MKLKILLILFALTFFQKAYTQNENLGTERRLTYKQQVDNKFVEVVFKARPGNFLSGETFFHFKLEKIIIHTWEIDGKTYTKNNSNGILPASGKLGHIYVDVKIQTINNQPNEYWEKNGFQMNKMTDFQDIDYDGKTKNNFWLIYAHISDCVIKSVHISDWFEIQQKIKGEEVSNTDNSSNNTSNTNDNQVTDINNQLDKILSDPNFIQNNPKLLQEITNLSRNTDFSSETSMNLYVEKAQQIVKKYLNFSESKNSAVNNNTTSITNTSNSSSVQRVAKEMNLRSDEVEILEIFNNSKNLNEAWSKLQGKGMQNVNKHTLNALNKITIEIPNFPITGSEIQSLLNGGSFKDVLKNYNFRASNKIAQDLGLDYNQTQILNIVSTSDNKEEMTKRLKERNIQQISESTANGLQKMLGDSYNYLPITSNDITNMLNGDFESALYNINRNQNINNLASSMDGNRELATATNDLIVASATAIAEGIDKNKINKAKSFIDFANSFKVEEYFKNNNKSYKSLKPYNYITDFSDNNWVKPTNKYAKVENNSTNEIKISINKEYDKKYLKKEDNIFLVFDNNNLQLKNDFEITFNYGFSSLKHFEYKQLMKSALTEKPFKVYKLMKKNSENGFALFISNTNKILISPSLSFFSNSFTPSLNMYQTNPMDVSSSSKISRLKDFDVVLYNDIYKMKLIQNKETKKAQKKAEDEIEKHKKEVAHLSLIKQSRYFYDIAEKQREKAKLAIEKEEKEIKNIKRENPELYRKLYKKPKETDITFYAIKIIKTGLKLRISITNKDGDIQSLTVDYKYSDKDKIYFGLGNSALSERMGYAQKGEFFIIKDFAIKQ